MAEKKRTKKRTQKSAGSVPASTKAPKIFTEEERAAQCPFLWTAIVTPDDRLALGLECAALITGARVAIVVACRV